MQDFIQKIIIQHLPHFSSENVEAAVLRLDLLHPVVSGNKWFKLQYYLADALADGSHTIATFGGAYSNHIAATAFAARQIGLKSIGYIRGEMPAGFMPILSTAQEYGMELRFVDRSRYRDKETIMEEESQPGWYWIMEGGYGKKGAEGAATILEVVDTCVYTHICCAVGTGTMMAGLIKRALPGQQVTGISVLKNNFVLEKEVRALLNDTEAGKPFSLLHDYHFGGYAKHPPLLIEYMKEIWFNHAVPTDIVYTARLFFAVQDLINNKDHFPKGSRLLLIHSGGLQGNHSLPLGTLPF